MRLLEYYSLSAFLLSLVTANRQNRLKRTIIGYYPLCPRGCASCSPVNGCITCRPRMFLLLHRQGMRQTGVCLPSCPAGYFGLRRRDYNKCQRCRATHCQVCFSRTYCTRCHAPYLSYRGQCVDKCPAGLHYANYTKDCLEKVDCEVGQWSSWGVCNRNGETCGFKYGAHTRSREIVQFPSNNGNKCPVVMETRKCKSLFRSCSDLSHNTSEPPSKSFRKWKRHKRRRHRKRRIRRRRRQKDRSRRRNSRNRRIPRRIPSRQKSRPPPEEQKQINNILVEK